MAAAAVTNDWPTVAYSRRDIDHQLYDWRTRLNEARIGTGHAPEVVCLAQLDRWLDERLDLRGR